MKTLKITLTAPTVIDGKVVEAGETVEVSEALARQLFRRARAETATEKREKATRAERESR